ncbi:MAG: hypothetical protein ACP5HX_06620 [Thermoproteota archaeon]
MPNEMTSPPKQIGFEKVVEHYSKKEVREEIFSFSKNRWVAIHCQRRDKKNRNLMFRYKKDGHPLTIGDPDDIEAIMKSLKIFFPRTFYSSVLRFNRVLLEEDVKDLSNATAAMPTWDIDLEKDDWKLAVFAAKLILKALESENVSKSVILKWSGEGMHVHINDNAFSSEIYKKIHPLDLAYSITEYIIRKIRKDLPIGVRVDNEIDPQRVFTAPLSLHRNLDRVAVVIERNSLDSFNLSWVSIDSYIHFSGWKDFEKGEADDLAKKAFLEIGGYPSSRKVAPRRDLGEDISDKIKEIEKKLKDDGYL